MPDARVSHLVRELRNGGDVSAKLADIWPMSGKQSMSLSDSLKLANSLIKVADTMKTPAALRAYHAAVVELRFLSGHLKKPESSDLMAPVANVEKYSVNYALRACEAELLDAALPLTASDVADEILFRMFSARNPSLAKAPPQSKTPKKKAPTLSRSRKENVNPQKSNDPACDNDGLFTGAGSSVKEFLPRSESPVIASVILGAIAVRVSAKNDSLSLSTRRDIAIQFGVPWGRHLGQFATNDPKHGARKDAHLQKMKNALLIASKMPNCDPVDAVTARACAVGMCKPTLVDYAYNILRVLNSFFRRRKKDGLSEIEEYRVASNVYSGTMNMLTNSKVALNDWMHEDLSTLLDHIIMVEARSSTLDISGMGSISKDALSQLLASRSSALESGEIDYESCADDFQRELYSAKAYELLAMDDLVAALELLDTAMQETLPKMLVAIGKTFSKYSLLSKPKKMISAKCALRLMRVLEPFRSKLCAKSDPLTEEQAKMLQLYVSVCVMGVLSPKASNSKAPKERLSVEDMKKRLHDMIGSCIEACERLMTSSIVKCDAALTTSTRDHIDAFLAKSETSRGKWGIWLVRRMNKYGIEVVNREKSSAGANKELLVIMGDVLASCTRWLERCLLPDVSATFKKHEHVPDFVNAVVMAVQCYIAAGKKDKALSVTAQKLLRSFCFEPSILAPGMMNDRTRVSFLKTCGQMLAMACEESKVETFIELLSTGQSLTGHTWNALGRNVVQALAEYSMELRRLGRTESVTISRLLRSTVKARDAFLNAFKLTGKCMALEVQREWNQLLLEGTSVGKEDLKTDESKKGSLFSLSDITAATPQGGWSSDTIMFGDGGSVEVELTPRQCHCSICSEDSFALLHILRDSWRLAVQKNPPLLRDHVGRLDRFLTSCNCSRLHPTMSILSLDFLEWCQVFSILNSIDDRMGSMSRMITMLKKQLELRAPDDAGSIYSSHGFLAGRPYYSRLIDQEGKSDYRVTFFEKEQFLYLGCKSDLYLQNLDLAKALETAKKSLCLLLDRLRRHDDAESSMRTKCGVGGLDIWIHSDIISTLDRTRLLETLELIFALERLGSASLKTENFNDAKYFLEKAVAVSKDLCGAESLLHLRQKTVLVKNNAISSDGSSEIESFLQVGSNAMAERSEGQFDKTLVSDAYAEAADVALAALSANVAEGEKVRELGELAAKFSGLAMDVLYDPTDTTIGVDNLDEREVTSMISTDISVRSGEAQLWLGNNSLAVGLFEKLRDEAKDNRLDVYLTALLGLATSLVSKLGGAEKVSALLQKASKRRGGRKSKDTVVAESVAKMLREADDILQESQWDPHRRMELFTLLASVFGESESDTRLAWEIGGGFTLRWELMNRKKLGIEGQGDEEELVRLVKDVSISSKKKSFTEEVEELRGLLSKGDLVVVGIAFDAMNDKLMVWRCTAAGFFSTHLQLPTHGDTSYRGILERFRDVFAKQKSNAAKTDQEFTEDQKGAWWGRTFELDETVRNIIADVQSAWFGEASTLLHPSCEDADIDELTKLTGKLDIHGNVRPSASSSNVVLILDPQVEHIPFESLPVLRKATVGVTRAPSLAYLVHQLRVCPSRPSARSVYYLLNPGGDLTKTEEKFNSAFKRESGWTGRIGQVDAGNTKALASAARNADILLYCGHGGGEKYVTPASLVRANGSDGNTGTPVAVLMGCSSARLQRHAAYRGSSGTPLEYLLHGAPAVVGNLWDVTDKDIDRLTVSLLRNWLDVPSSRKKTKTKCLADALANARSACKLPHLVGAATVIYGIPFL